MGMAIPGCTVGLAIAISAVSAVPPIGWLLLVIYIVIGAGIYLFMQHKRKTKESYREIVLSPRDIPEEK